jgi:hypothetical protein
MVYPSSKGKWSSSLSKPLKFRIDEYVLYLGQLPKPIYIKFEPFLFCFLPILRFSFGYTQKVSSQTG